MKPFTILGHYIELFRASRPESYWWHYDKGGVFPPIFLQTSSGIPPGFLESPHIRPHIRPLILCMAATAPRSRRGPWRVQVG